MVRPASFREKRKNQTDSENSLDAELLHGVKVANPLAESKDTLSGSNFEHLSQRRLELMSRDWRHFFEENELDKAFQRVEIEQREISEEGSSAGSTSNPSDGNLEQEELAENVYNLEEQKLKEQLQQRKEQEEKLLAQVKEQPVMSGQQLYNKLAGKSKDEPSNSKENVAGKSV